MKNGEDGLTNEVLWGMLQLVAGLKAGTLLDMHEVVKDPDRSEALMAAVTWIEKRGRNFPYKILDRMHPNPLIPPKVRGKR